MGPHIPSFSVLVLCFILEGATNAFGVVYKSMLADSAPSGGQAGAFTAYEICGAVGMMLSQLASVAILRMELLSYAAVWLVLSGVVLADVLYVMVATEETLIRKPPAASARETISAVLVAPFSLVANNGFLSQWLLSGAMTTLAAGQSAILATFTIAVYNWPPGTFQGFTWFKNLLRAGSLALVGPLAKELPSSLIVLADAGFSVLTQLPRMAAPFSPAFLLGSLYAADTLSFTQPSLDAYITSKFPPEKRGTVMAMQHFCSNISTSLSVALFSSHMLFNPSARGWQATWPFVVAFVMILQGVVLRLVVIRPDVRKSWKIFRDVADDDTLYKV